ncbi:SpoIIIAH-like family protein [Radiobacillus sp. PE A8.2]|uniref:SpoIIIAH-like family protein n=1 Tax=Radiobacillus sp. PE A8.2 TaxID=3380349 RepID=UPI00388DC345
MLKKQTVWLLTMLSLMIVLSVYYMSSPTGDDLAYTNQDEEVGDQTAVADSDSEDLTTEGEGQTGTEADSESDMEGQDTAGNSPMDDVDELFTMTRLELADERSKMIDYYKDVVASSTASTDEINAAWEEIKDIEQLSTKERILEETIKTEKQYEDVLVRADEKNVVITVKADEMSKKEAQSIMMMASQEFGNVDDINVKYQPSS